MDRVMMSGESEATDSLSERGCGAAPAFEVQGFSEGKNANLKGGGIWGRKVDSRTGRFSLKVQEFFLSRRSAGETSFFLKFRR